jgi:Putative transposase/Transposase zinc-binding domain
VLVPHSCGDRHCPICSGRKRFDFAQRAEQLILDGVTYYQVVFTLPSELSELALVNREAIADLLFTSAWKSLRKTIRTEQGYDPAAMMVLHTWNQRMDSHWHVHALVPGGGPSLATIVDPTRGVAHAVKRGALSEPELWKQAVAPERADNSSGFYLVDAISLRELFRKVAIAHLKRLRQSGKLVLRGKFAHLTDDAPWQQFCDKLKSVDWVSYIQPPPTDTSTADQVVRYLTRYLTGGPISDSRIVAADKHQVTFLAREGRVTGGERGQVPVTVSTTKFIQDWCMHIQPSQLTKTRYCGGWSSRRRTEYVEHCQELRGSIDFDPGAIEAIEDSAASHLDQRHLVNTAKVETDEPSVASCPHCENQPMRLTGQTAKPSWSDILRHTDPRCPAWYAEQEKESWIKFLEDEYGVDYETWYLETQIESAIGSRDSATASQHRQTPSSQQLYFAGLEPERYYLLESFEAVDSVAV